MFQFILRHKSCPLVPHARVHIPGAWERAGIAQGLDSFWQLKALRRRAGSRWVHPAHLPLHLCRGSPGTPGLPSARAGNTSVWPRPFLFFFHSTCRIYSDLAWSWISPATAGPKQVLKAARSSLSYQVSAESSIGPHFLLVPARDIGLGSVSSSFNSPLKLAILVVAFKKLAPGSLAHGLMENQVDCGGGADS